MIFMLGLVVGLTVPFLFEVSMLHLVWGVPAWLAVCAGLSSAARVRLVFPPDWSAVFFGVLVIAVCAALTWYQFEWIATKIYWISFRLVFIPISAIGLTGFGVLVGGVILVSGFVDQGEFSQNGPTY
ncbi:MAG: hypothetical protein FJ303_23400 [Planctomycetes bacterium]|nr:hypothetical protein [Planctomycetota bacterium]